MKLRFEFLKTIWREKTNKMTWETYSGTLLINTTTNSLTKFGWENDSQLFFGLNEMGCNNEDVFNINPLTGKFICVF